MTSNRPKIQNILNVIDKGSADNTSPYFAASALALHIPFRSINSLLNGFIFTERLKIELKSSNNEELKRYVSNCMTYQAEKRTTAQMLKLKKCLKEVLS